MKNRFIQMFLVICAVMLMICAVSVWADAEDVTATPTDLAPVDSAEMEETEEENADKIEIRITKEVHIGETWSGLMKKTKPAILKLDLDRDQLINVLVTGKDIWVSVEKADKVTENPTRILTDDETSQAVISWYAEAGSYLITVGSVEPNPIGKAEVTIMDNTAFEAWKAQQEKNEEPAEGVQEENELNPEEAENEPESEKTDTDNETEEEYNPEAEDSGIDNELAEGSKSEYEETDKDTEPEEGHNQEADQKTEEADQNKEDAIDEDLLISLGYYKVQVALKEGTDLFEAMDDSAEPVEHMETGDELWVKATENEIWAEVYSNDETLKTQYVKWNDLIIVKKPESEEEEEEILPARYIKITSTITDYKYIALGTEIKMTAELFNFRDDDTCEYQWKYYDEVKEEYVDIEGANELTYSYGLTYENIYYNWKLVVTLTNEEE